MKDALFSLLFFLVLVGVDWALVDGFRRSMLAFCDIPEEYNYRRFIFPRIIAILISAVLLYISSRTDTFGRHGVSLSFVSVGIFFLSSFYPQIVMFLRSKAY